MQSKILLMTAAAAAISAGTSLALSQGNQGEARPDGNAVPSSEALTNQTDRGQMNGFDFYRDLLGATRPAMTFDDLYRASVANKLQVMATQRRLLESRYNLEPRLDPVVTMSRGKPLAVGPTAKLPAGMTWEALAQLSAAEIRDRDIFPYKALPHAKPEKSSSHRNPASSQTSAAKRFDTAKTRNGDRRAPFSAIWAIGTPLPTMLARHKSNDRLSRPLLSVGLCCRSQTCFENEYSVPVCLADTEQAMTAKSLAESAFYRVVVVAAATTLVMTAVVFAKPFYSAGTDSTPTDRAGAGEFLKGQAPQTVDVSFVTSPTMDTDPKFFFGTGDGSNGYYAERPRSQ